MKTINWGKRRSRTLLLMAIIFALPLAAFAQNARLQLNNLEKLKEKAAEVNDIALDGAMLQMALKFMDMDHDPEAVQVRQAFRDLKGIYVKNFEFDGPNQYSQSDVEAIRAQLAGPAWSRVVESRSIRARENAEIFIMKDGDKIGGLAVLVAEPSEFTVINIVGGIDLDKLDALDGNFGIHLEHRDHHRKPSAEDQHEKD